jgi:Ribbon-helix-helix protein, copG family.
MNKKVIDSLGRVRHVPVKYHKTEPRKIQVAVRVTPEIDQTINSIVAKSGKQRSEVIREIIKKGIEKWQG